MENKKENRVKLYGVILGLLTLALQHGFYLLGHGLASLFQIAPYLPKINAIDDLIPICAVFIIPYVWSYAFWAMAPMAVSKCKFDHFLDYLATYLFACVIGMLVLAFAPTYMDRVAENLYDTTKTGFFYDLMHLWYKLDGGGRMAYNLLPSFHCINSTVSYLGVAGRKEIPLWYRIYSCVLMFIIFASTLFVKQHYFLDVISGAAIGVVTFIVCKKVHAGRIFLPLVDFIREKTGKDKKGD